jgi:uncharacterized repeat protein (TIGR01451 family)
VKEGTKTTRATRLVWSFVLGLGLVVGLLWALMPRSTAVAQSGGPGFGLAQAEMRVNYGHDWVGGDYPAGHTFWITVTDSGGMVKATAAVSTTHGGGWGGDGFETEWQDWSPPDPDIEPGDWAYFQADDGYSNAIRVGTVTGTVDMDDDSVGGNIYATWFTQMLDVKCHAWGAPGGAPSKNSTAAPDGSVPYFCQWDPVTEWDILPGQDVAVMYLEPDGDRVINVFMEPAPDMRVEKWTEGSEAAPGGPAVFTIRYENEGNADATTVLLTDTLPSGTTYVTDTSGFPATVGAGQVTWSFGPVAAGERGQFQLVLTNTASSSDTLRNEADISTLYDFRDWNDHDETQVHVTEGQPDLYVDKHAEPNDPAPGQTFLYEIDYGNNGPAASGPAVLTDTLPEDTTVVSWYSEDGYDLWREVSTGGDQLVLTAPTIPGNWGDRIVLRLRLSNVVTYNTQLTNTVEITTTGDTDPDNNRDMHNDVWVGEPWWGVGVHKAWGWGQLVPGGQIGYHIDYGNHRNMSAQTWLADTLPAGTTFITSTRSTGYDDVPVTPSYVGGGIVAWDLGVLEPGERGNMELIVAIAPTVAPDTPITNCATIAITQTEDWPYDNAECAVETVRTAGPNLRVRKEARWGWEGQIEYEIRIENIGTTRMEDIWVTDTYPISTTFNDDWWGRWGPWITATHDAPNRQIVFWVEELGPGDTGGVGFRVDLDGSLHGVQGLIFTNTVTAPWPGDIYPADNTDVALAYTGPDVYVEKWLSGGEPRPGEIVTFTVEFGNRNEWWSGDDHYGSHITDTLPAAMTFITATAPWDPNEPWTPDEIDGSTVSWGWGTMWDDSTWYFDLVARIADTLEGGDVITNVIRAYGDSPYDVEPFWDNNVFELPITVLDPKFEVGKVYESSRVAGSAVTYTLTVTNTGSHAGTNVVLSDTVPAHLSDVHTDGALGGGDVVWTFSRIPAGGTATGWFSAKLPYTPDLTIVNDAYGVRGSDQGVTSPAGAPVSFTVEPIHIFLPLVMRNYGPPGAWHCGSARRLCGPLTRQRASLPLE